MKTAKITIVALNADCPHCGEALTSRTGSLMLTIEDVDSSNPITCDGCGRTVKLPKTAKIDWQAV